MVLHIKVSVFFLHETGALMKNFSLDFEPNRFDVDGYVTGFGNPEWLRTHPPASQTAPAVLSILKGGATCIGKTIMDEMAYRYQENLAFTLSFPFSFHFLQLITNKQGISFGNWDTADKHYHFALHTIL